MNTHNYYILKHEEKFKINKKYSPKMNYKILFLLTMNFIIIYTTIKIYEDIEFSSIFYDNKFDKILPRINLNISEAPNLNDLFKSRKLYISDTKLTKEYIKYIRPKNLTKKNSLTNKTFEGIEPDLSFTKNRKKQIKMRDYYDLCQKEKILSNQSNFNLTKNPLVSILVIAYNKKDIILKSIRSIQNQSLRNIEIIILNDKSTDDSEHLFNQLLKSDERIRIFTHLKNMGAWRSRLDAFLYSNSPYVIHFDAGDFYADNFVLEDIYNIAIKYNLDSIRFGFRLTRAKKHLSKRDSFHLFKENDRKIIYGKRYYGVFGYTYGTIWNRLTKADIFTEGLYHLDNYILNAYKNIYDDRWWNTLANNESCNFLMTNRIGYIYLRDSKGEGHIRSGNKKIKEKSIKEVILFFLFDYNLAYSKSNKSSIIKNLKDYNKGKRNIKLSDLKSNFPPYNHLLHLLIKDKYISKEDKLFILYLKHNIKY